jgi:hypothetical protein
MEWLEPIWGDFLTLFVGLASAGILAVLAYGVAILRKKLEQINNDLFRETLEGALNEAYAVGRDAVKATNQVLVNNIKEKNADGKLTAEEAVQALEHAFDYFTKHISNNSKSILEKAIGPLNNWVWDFLEARVDEAKAEKRQIHLKVEQMSTPKS